MSLTRAFDRKSCLTAAISLAACWSIATADAATANRAASEKWEVLTLLGREVAPGTVHKFPFIPDRSFEASYLNMPVFAARGASPGPTLCLTAGVHGDELNGVEVARRAFARVDPKTMRGTLIALPAINSEGVRTGNRYLSDRRDLNRAFPGQAGGSVASLIAHAVFSRVLTHCDALVDLHTASNNRTNLPQVRADIGNAAIRELAIHFGVGIVLGGEGPKGSLRSEAAKAGVAAIIYEAGEPYRFQQEEIVSGVLGVESVMAYLDMTEQEELEIPEARVYEKSSWVRAPVGGGGFFFPSAKLGDVVEAGDSLGRIVDPLTDEIYEVTSPIRGEIVGMSVPQPVLSGYALFHLAWHESD
ncbi:MAG: succinylglutamate desuccinylase/aspartoacylase family protein [Deltaproteobacteria bacterium]|jgi:predicted deacylase|nr:succinylglutamate desuccinylase/aspartoacylase family protein [Deltaproteobacteria bacterium]MBW2496227.1 succinylglutamate desuccinylase/aspartoacylase family protein [Deltaproteobacteria bacterium]